MFFSPSRYIVAFFFRMNVFICATGKLGICHFGYYIWFGIVDCFQFHLFHLAWLWTTYWLVLCFYPLCFYSFFCWFSIWSLVFFVAMKLNQTKKRSHWCHKDNVQLVGKFNQNENLECNYTQSYLFGTFFATSQLILLKSFRNLSYFSITFAFDPLVIQQTFVAVFIYSVDFSYFPFFYCFCCYFVLVTVVLYGVRCALSALFSKCNVIQLIYN